MKSKAPNIIGWVITILICAGMAAGAFMSLTGQQKVFDTLCGKYGYPRSSVFYLGIAQASCVLLYLFPRTAILGAVLLTGFLGGAVSTHVRAAESFAPPAIAGVLVWLGIYFRDSRVRALLPFRSRGGK